MGILTGSETNLKLKLKLTLALTLESVPATQIRRIDPYQTHKKNHTNGDYVDTRRNTEAIDKSGCDSNMDL